ncbi:Nose resistant to fluoxetine protein 6 [Fasciola hepatica]|uniref:Nose resistant to fluoxetine protein 6 n=1 Tax=Fasciola hepatica TaxID=6192 RepID=A0A4E0REW3_FASHE|nr:Nose resistant to fluoxetine protein 6 [Fasciola hepatica]
MIWLAISFVLFSSLMNFSNGDQPDGLSPRYPRYSFHSGLSKILWSGSTAAHVQNSLFINTTTAVAEEFANIKQQWRKQNFDDDNDCLKDVFSIIESFFHDPKMYNYKWIDASGRPMPGIAGGALHWPGNYYLCTGNFPEFNPNNTIPISDLTVNVTRGSYCDLVIDLDTSSTLPSLPTFGLSIGLCIPVTCNYTEAIILLDLIFSSFSLKIDKSASYCHTSPDNLPKDSWFWIAIALITVIVLLLSCGTAVDFAILFDYKMKKLKNAEKNKNPAENGSLSEEAEHMTASVSNLVVNYEEQEFSVESFLLQRSKYLQGKPLILQWLSTFAAPTNMMKLIYAPRKRVKNEDGKSTDHPLNVLDGIRVITMAWIVYGHSVVFPLTAANNPLLYVQTHVKRWTFEVIINGTLSVDTFFLMSGILAAYFGVPQVTRIKSFVRWIHFWCVYLVHRFIRLTPAYLAVIILYTGFFLHAWEGPLYPQRAEMTDIQFCRSNWWTTYLNNFIHSSQMCIPWSWYLANEFQFSVVLAPIFLSLVKWHSAAGLVFAVALILSCSFTTFGLSYKNHFKPGLLSIDSFDVTYIKPYTRWGSYAVGLVLGWMLHCNRLRLSQKVTVMKSVLITTAGLLFASICCLSVIYGLHGLISGEQPEMTNTVSAFYNAVHRTVFVIGIATVIYLCANGYAAPVRAILGWSGFIPLSRLTYGTYLLHPIIILFISLGSQSPLMLDDLSIITIFVTALCFSYLGSLLLSVSVESPILWIEKLIQNH